MNVPQAQPTPDRPPNRRLLTVTVAIVVLLAVLVALGLVALRFGGRPGDEQGLTIAAVGDLVCDPDRDAAEQASDDDHGRPVCQQRAVSDLVLSRRPAAFLALGDTQYEEGTLNDFRSSYAPTFGRLLDVTYPVPGNHEYRTRGAKGYYAYFGERAGSPEEGYYSFDLGGWHIVALNSNCDDVSCEAGDKQEQWLRADLAANPARCTLAFWHHPRWSNGRHGDQEMVDPLVQALHDADAELILAGHDHNYQRFEPRSPTGAPARDGLRQFVVGTGGRNLRDVAEGNGAEVVDDDNFGALFLTLTATGYRWEFVSVGGSGFSDSGRGGCH